jgi:DNA-binding NarL/FixJ family response regulator
MDGVEATRRIRRELAGTQVIILSTFDDDEYVFEGLAAGAKGYLLKDVSSEGLADAIRKVHQGQALLPPSIASKVVTEFSRLAEREHRRREQPLIEPLSVRELEVLELVAGGLSNREIGARLFITEGTVKNHVSNILTKLGVRDRTQAVLRAQELGLL